MNSFPQKTTIKILLSPRSQNMFVARIFNLRPKCTVFYIKNANFISPWNAIYEK